jgi:hypothetical protein
MPKYSGLKTRKQATMLENKELAQTICDRLNTLLQDPGVREALQKLIDTRVPVSEDVANHQTIQCQEESPTECSLGLLGVLNGIIGGSPGYLMASLNDDSGELLSFLVRE